MKKIVLLLWSFTLFQIASSQAPLLTQIEANNPQLRAARHANQALMADLRSDNRPGQTSVEYSPFYQDGVSGTSSSELIVSQEFDFPTLYAARSRQANAQQQALDLQYAILRRDILLQSQQLCIDLATAQKMQQLLASRLAAADSLLHVFSLRLGQGDATLIDLNRIKMDRMAVRTEAIRLDATLHSLRLSLQQLNGGQPIDEKLLTDYISRYLTGTDEGSPVDTPLPTGDGSNRAADLSGPALSLSPLEVASAQASLQVTREEVRVAQQGWLPSLTLGYRRNTELREAQNGFLVGVSVPLFSNSGKVRAARLRRSAAEDEITNAQLEQDTRMKTLQNQSQQLQLILEAYDEALMHQQLSLLHRAVMAGELSVIDYYNEAERIYTLLQERLTVASEYAKANAEIRRDCL